MGQKHLYLNALLVLIYLILSQKYFLFYLLNLYFLLIFLYVKNLFMVLLFYLYNYPHYKYHHFHL